MALIVGTCSQCGAGVPADARTMGLCPRCLMRSVLGGGSAGTGSYSGVGRMDPPAVDDLAGEIEGLEFVELIGRGGMGFVYTARQRSLDRLVAVKLFPRGAGEDPEFAERFAHEARVLASLNHPGIVGAHEFGETPRFYFLVMELVRGGSLRRWIDRGPLPREVAVGVGRQVCEALEYAHARGVVHRDVKPENVLLEGEPGAGVPRVRVADFGLAKLVERRAGDWALTAPNRLMGTPDYMAPEQRRTPGEVDARADVYALGVVLYEMLTGHLPLGRFAVPTSDAGLNRVVMRCLETDAAKRFGGAGEVRRAVEGLRADGAGGLAGWGAAGLVALALAGGGIIWATRDTGRDRGGGGDGGKGVWIGPSTRVTGERATTPATTTTAPAVAATSRPAADAPSPDTPAFIAVREFGPPVGGPWGGGFGPPGTAHEDPRARMVREFGEERIVRVYVDDVPEAAREFVIRRLKEIAGVGWASSRSSGRTVRVELAPVRDVHAFARAIDVGTVVKVDGEGRVLEVRADAKKVSGEGR